MSPVLVHAEEDISFNRVCCDAGIGNAFFFISFSWIVAKGDKVWFAIFAELVILKFDA